MSSFKEHFSYVRQYNEGYGYAVDAKNTQDAVEKIFEYLDFSWYDDNQKQRLRRELRENMRQCWVRFQGWMDDDGEFFNTWVITSEWKGMQPRYFQVYATDWDRHYVDKGHRYEPKADEPGNRVNYSYNKWDCDVCNQIHILEDKLKKATECVCPDGMMWHSINCPVKNVGAKSE